MLLKFAEIGSNPTKSIVHLGEANGAEQGMFAEDGPRRFLHATVSNSRYFSQWERSRANISFASEWRDHVANLRNATTSA